MMFFSENLTTRHSSSRLVNTEKGGVAQSAKLALHMQPRPSYLFIRHARNMQIMTAPRALQAMERAVNGFRKQFAFSNLPLANWFPGHMAKGAAKVMIHCINEVAFLISHSNSLYECYMLVWHYYIRIKRHCKTTAVLWLCHWSSWCKSIHTDQPNSVFIHKSLKLHSEPFP